MKKELSKKDYSKQGKKNRAAGVRFEAKVRQELEAMGWVVSKWMNTVDYENWKLVPAKRKYNPFKKAMVIGTGFPDLIAFKRNESGFYEVIGIEVKRRGYLDKVEKGMCHWLIENKIFYRILIARAKKNGRKLEVEYDDFKEKYGVKKNKS